MSHWIESHRPRRLNEIVGQQTNVLALTRLLKSNNLPHLLFYGPAGTGKTSTILAIAQELNENDDWRQSILELNASDDRGIDVVRNRIKTFVSTAHVSGVQNQTKIVILDEVDAMTFSAQAALRRVIEKFTYNARFCLICNELSRLIPAIQSRCARFRFGPLSPLNVQKCLRNVQEKENVQCDAEAIDAITQVSKGDARRAVNVLQSASLASTGEVTADAVFKATGTPTPEHVHDIVKRLFVSTCLRETNEHIHKLLRENGYSLNDLLHELHASVLCVKLTSEKRSAMIQALADIEERLASGSSEKVQLASLIASFFLIRSEDKQE